MLKEDKKVEFFKTKYDEVKLYEGGYSRKISLSAAEYKKIIKKSKEKPIRLPYARDYRTWWLYQGKFYRDEDSLTEAEVQALLWDAQRRREKRVKRAMAMMAQEEAVFGNRERLADDVKLFVWNRDGGRCVKCGGQERLEFDHIIPVSKGGSSTARNIQLLCESCNREKSDSLI